ncbi:CsgG/HfaB family protein [Sphingosinicella rhizophila]|uniref:CsgG/HfaB family protein n=1 Tax=Sphingosinicella rhizophila TaxID=3050082 RepID=A0ABU3Q681_9SPHN|nr:CsgG/HfaB family protein [Sphingosinicella sp. GR2756]MDT9598914.1 CsgG/HfaB family protein [Sphingosinicella sp. GR2756]
MNILNGRSLRAPRFLRTTMLLTMAAVTLSACTVPQRQTVAPGEISTVMGPAVRTNRTPMEGALACFADHVASTKRPPLVIAVGDIKDYTGKYNISEGNAITQGGSLMVYSALGKLGGAVRIAERFDPTIAERELGYIDRRQLGDGQIHELGGADGKQQVPWVPYFGGSITQSDYFIIGGITELNYNINSGGAEAGVNQMGIKARTYHQSIAIDLRIVDTHSLMVVKTISLSKQLTGYEIGLNIFRFFDNDLFDVNVGAKGQEPLQLGVRTALEEGVVRLVGAVTQVDPEPCMTVKMGSRIPPQSADELRQHADPGPALVPAGQSAAPGGATYGAISSLPSTGSWIQIPFEVGAPGLNSSALSALEKASTAAQTDAVDIVLVARDTEQWDPGKRDALIDQRIAAVVSGLASRGIPQSRIRVTWRPAATDNTLHRDGPGMIEIAKLRIGT